MDLYPYLYMYMYMHIYVYLDQLTNQCFYSKAYKWIVVILPNYSYPQQFRKKSSVEGTGGV